MSHLEKILSGLSVTLPAGCDPGSQLWESSPMLGRALGMQLSQCHSAPLSHPSETHWFTT